MKLLRVIVLLALILSVVKTEVKAQEQRPYHYYKTQKHYDRYQPQPRHSYNYREDTVIKYRSYHNGRLSPPSYSWKTTWKSRRYYDYKSTPSTDDSNYSRNYRKSYGR